MDRGRNKEREREREIESEREGESNMPMERDRDRDIERDGLKVKEWVKARSNAHGERGQRERMRPYLRGRGKYRRPWEMRDEQIDR